MGTLELQKLISSIHAPAKGATRLRSDKQQRQQYFNPRSREGSDRRNWTSDQYLPVISIHAPVKGATVCSLFLFLRLVISIHAPVKGATQ